MCNQQACLSRKNCPCEIFTVYSKTSSHKEKILVGFIHILPAISSTTWARRTVKTWVNRDSSAGSWKGIHPQQQSMYIVWAHAPAWEGQPHGELSCGCSGNDTFITASPDLLCSANSLASPSLFPPLLRLVHTPSQRAFCCQSWQDWLEGYTSAGTFPGPWVWAKMGLTLHRVETNPTCTYLRPPFRRWYFRRCYVKVCVPGIFTVPKEVVWIVLYGWAWLDPSSDAYAQMQKDKLRVQLRVCIPSIIPASPEIFSPPQCFPLAM